MDSLTLRDPAEITPVEQDPFITCRQSGKSSEIPQANCIIPALKSKDSLRFHQSSGSSKVSPRLVLGTGAASTWIGPGVDPRVR